MGLLNWIRGLKGPKGPKGYEKNIVLTIKDKSKIPHYILEQYAKYAPKYNLQIFDDEDCKAFLKEHYGVEFVAKFESFQMGCHKADFFRYAYLFKMGGIYLDVKTILICPMEDIFVDHRLCYIVRSIIPNSIYNGIIHTPPRNPLFRMLLMDLFHTHTLNVINYLKPTYKMHKILKLFTSHELVLGLNKLEGCCDVMIYEERDFQNLNKMTDRHGWNTYVMKDFKMLFKVRDHKYLPNYDMSELPKNRRSISKVQLVPVNHMGSNVQLVLDNPENWLTNTEEVRELHANPEWHKNPGCHIPSTKKEVTITLTSRSMFGQDVMLLKCFEFKRNGYYVDIGSAQGDTNNHTYLMDVQFDWKGLSVDPYPLNMKERKCKIHKGVVYHSNTEVEFVCAGLQSGIRSYGNDPKGEVVFKRASRTEDVLNKANVPSYVDVLCVSVEGAELSVLRGLDFSTRRFETVMVHTGKGEERLYNTSCFMQDLGYTTLWRYEQGVLFQAPKTI
jgi:hypothetical protein